MLLAIGEVSPPVTDPCQVAVFEKVEIRVEGAGQANVVVKLFAVRLSKQDVFPHRARCTPWALRNLGDGTTLTFKMITRDAVKLAKNGLEKR